MFLTIKRRNIVAVICIIILCGIMMGVFFTAKHVFASRGTQTIVIDAGHGGRDAGCSGINTGVSESEIALSIAKKLETNLQNIGYKVVMTRTNSDGLYDQNASNFKKSDMAKRKKIIEKADADMVISIHLNAYPAITERGAQVFYQSGNESGKSLSQALSTQLSCMLPSARSESIGGDYYILKCADVPSSIVECGFLSNPEEEALLVTDDYQSKVAYAIMCGVVAYFGIESQAVGV